MEDEEEMNLNKKEKDKDMDEMIEEEKLDADEYDNFKGFGGIDIKEENLGEKEKALLTYKRKREKRSKKMPKDSSKVKKTRKIRSLPQQLFDLISKRDVITQEIIAAAAEKLNYELTPEHVTFFKTLGEAKARLRKYGVPGALCKNPFHIFIKTPFYKQTSVITSDINVWNCFYWYMTALNKEKGGILEYRKMCYSSSVKEFSFVTDKIFQCTNVQSGYVQDFAGKITLIAPGQLSEKDMENYVGALKSDPTSIVSTIPKPSEKTVNYQFYQCKGVLIVSGSKENFNDLIKQTANLLIVNSKNKLEKGLKEIKIDSNQGSYINIHDLKPTDFSPACLFIEPAIVSPKMFVKVDLDTNSVFNYLTEEISGKKTLTAINMPPNSIFWDNIDSAIQLFAFFKVATNIDKLLSAEIFLLVDGYYKNREGFSAYKRLYSTFESIVLSFYDKITTKLSIDSIAAMKKKVDKFISDYVYQRNDNTALNDIRDVINKLPGVFMMKNFITTNVPIQLVRAIDKIISLLNSATLPDEKQSMAELFKTVGRMCSEVLFDGNIPMIPKIRSHTAFLGGLIAEVNKAQFDENIKYLVDSYNESFDDYKKKIGKGGGGPGSADVPEFLNNADNLMSKMMKNTINELDSEYVRKNADTIIERVKADSNLMNSLRESYGELMKVNKPEDMEKFGNFLENDIFTGYLKTIDSMANVAVDNGGGIPVDIILSTMKVKPGAKQRKRMVFKKRLGLGLNKKKEGKKVYEIKKAPPIDAINVSDEKLALVKKYIPEENLEKFKNGLSVVIKETGQLVA